MPKLPTIETAPDGAGKIRRLVGHFVDGPWKIVWAGSHRTRIGICLKISDSAPIISKISNDRIFHFRLWRLVFNRKTRHGMVVTANNEAHHSQRYASASGSVLDSEQK